MLALVVEVVRGVDPMYRLFLDQESGHEMTKRIT